ncbi:cell division protein ZapE [Gordonia amicalis]|uniref:cell division protein ZapE n=1 Tax=Gordonia amicalis TaxID=89053 RepID=UPI0022B305F7|nr:cell division protein ZapE [Gordonia amicalis]MCZ4581505.1 cell division protein ZapE [Gordonia amicalis]
MSSARQAVVSGIEARAAGAGIVLDVEQQRLVARLADLAPRRSWPGRRAPAPRGLYVHGSAGRGKSWLANAFYDASPSPKVRVHFHSFFEELHRRAHEHRDNPAALTQAIADVLGDSDLLYFDELHVHDSGDARLLTRLLEYVFARQITVLATSNYAPHDLLPNPIWHHIFEPGIALITAHLDIYHLTGTTDYRADNHSHTAGFASGRWVTSPPPEGLPDRSEHTVLTVGGRRFPVLAEREGQLWVSFTQVCDSPVSTIEYVQWVHQFRTWVITDIPTFDTANGEAQQRFINLVDILVDTDRPTTFVSPHTLPAFLTYATTARPDAFRMASRLHLLRTT